MGSLNIHDTYVERYEILKEIAKGGVGTVYLTKDLHSSTEGDVHVALKVLHPKLLQSSSVKERFRREIEAGMQVVHRNIVKVYHYVDRPDFQACAMEYMDRGDLHLLLQAGQIPEKHVLAILLQVARGLDAVHAAGIVHRDLKPSNILLNSEGVVKITDFGFARLNEKQFSGTKTGVVVGTPQYVCPEYIECGECDHRGDIFALGIIGFQLLSGQMPFNHSSWKELVEVGFEKPLYELEELVPSVSDGLSAIVRRCLSYSIMDRYQSASEVTSDLLMVKEQLEDGPRIASTETTNETVKPVIDEGLHDVGQFVPLVDSTRATMESLGIETPSSHEVSRAALIVGLLSSIALVVYLMFRLM